MTHDLRNRNNKLVTAYWSATAVVASAVASVVPAFAADADFWTKIASVMNEIVGKIVGFSTLAAALCIAIALIIRMVSRNQRAVEESTQWIKRIAIGWLLLNSLNLIITYASNNFATSYTDIGVTSVLPFLG